MSSLKNISVQFGGIKALTDVSFEVEKNSLFREQNANIEFYFPYFHINS